jgi:hypothetical protein
MYETPAGWLSSLHPIIDREVCEDCHHEWGFTIYRTGYGPSTNHQWQRLLQTIQTHAHKATLRITGVTDDDPVFQQLWSLFRLDARSDTALSGHNVDQLQLLYNSSNGSSPPMNMDFPLHRIFLVADDVTFADAEPSTIKAVDGDYRAENYIPRNNWNGGQRYFGWMPMRAHEVAEMWKHLDYDCLDRIAPPTIKGSHLVIWENDCY